MNITEFKSQINRLMPSVQFNFHANNCHCYLASHNRDKIEILYLASDCEFKVKFIKGDKEMRVSNELLDNALTEISNTLNM